MALDREKLIADIMKEFESDGEPITRKEAEEVADLEIKSKKLKNYVSTGPRKKKEPKPRKVDNEKLEILKVVAKALENEGFECEIIKEIEINFNDFTLKLTRHRPKKK